MKLQVLAVKDRALDAFMRPFYAQTTAQGIRIFGDTLNHRESEMYSHPEDYDVFHLGEWNDQDGKYTQLELPVQLAMGRNMRNPRPEDFQQQLFAAPQQHARGNGT